MDDKVGDQCVDRGAGRRGCRVVFPGDEAADLVDLGREQRGPLKPVAIIPAIPLGSGHGDLNDLLGCRNRPRDSPRIAWPRVKRVEIGNREMTFIRLNGFAGRGRAVNFIARLDVQRSSGWVPEQLDEGRGVEEPPARPAALGKGDRALRGLR
jgi:hypothetical protein